KYTNIKDEKSLLKELTHLMSKREIEKERQPLLKEIISKERIQVVDSVTDWKEAISYSSKPLLDEGIIQNDYVDAMINAVEEYGPYIVLADEFALPHASNQSSVKEVAISVLVLKNSIDMKGKPVKIFMTLATVDNESHLKALSSLVDIISIDEKLEQIKNGSIEEIYAILKGGAK
ncbi:MAG TPA: PTS sugar transporter subunit IIA, partial [Erysipelothrix sp.]|nr:PTS sugar transporter subunit IIA [Erysipelothrix sp.]